MDRKLNIVRNLYGEDDASQLGRLLEGDEAARREYQALSEIKYHLDRQPRKRPDQAVLDNVFIAATEIGSPSRGRRDRAARASSRLLRVRAIGVVSSVLVLLAIASVGLGYFLNATQAPSGQSAAYEMATSSVGTLKAEAPKPESVTDRPPVTSPAVQAFSMPDAAPPAVPEVTTARVVEASESVPAAGERRKPTPVALEWDESEDVRRLHWQIGLIEARSPGVVWDDPVAPANGRRPLDSTRRGFIPAEESSVDWDR